MWRARLPSVLAVANVLIEEAWKADREIDILQLLKLAYIAYGFHLGFGRGRLFREEIQAWKYGPAIPYLYERVSHYGYDPITEKIGRAGTPLDEEKSHFVAEVYASYGKFSGSQLTRLTYKKGTPWELFFTPENHFRVIPDRLIEDYYKRFIEEHPRRAPENRAEVQAEAA